MVVEGFEGWELRVEGLALRGLGLKVEVGRLRVGRVGVARLGLGDWDSKVGVGRLGLEGESWEVRLELRLAASHPGF